jgi:GNAT superfamily N-acetyltransferase
VNDDSLTTSPPPIRTASESDENALVHVVMLAFSSDPLVRWFFPEPDRYVAVMPHLVRAFCGNAFVHGTAHYVDGYLGAALWLPPGVHPDDDAMATFAATSLPESRHPAMAELSEKMATFHPDEPCWYLPMIGVDPRHQGAGHGGRLLRHALAVCDRAGIPAYLESSNPRNIALYLRCGFEPLGAIKVEDAPTVTPMLRRPG